MNQSHLISDYKYIKDSFNLSIETYVNEYKSLHWQYFYNKKNNLLNEQKIIEFRKNEFSQGLDDKSTSLEGLKNFYTDLESFRNILYIISIIIFLTVSLLTFKKIKHDFQARDNLEKIIQYFLLVCSLLPILLVSNRDSR